MEFTRIILIAMYYVAVDIHNTSVTLGNWSCGQNAINYLSTCIWKILGWDFVRLLFIDPQKPCPLREICIEFYIKFYKIYRIFAESISNESSRIWKLKLNQFSVMQELSAVASDWWAVACTRRLHKTRQRAVIAIRTFLCFPLPYSLPPYTRMTCHLIAIEHPVFTAYEVEDDSSVW